MREAQNEVMKCRQIFRLKSSEALGILVSIRQSHLSTVLRFEITFSLSLQKTMIEESKNSKVNIVTSNFPTSAASTFSFDLSKLNPDQPSISMDSGSSFNSLKNQDSACLQTDEQRLPMNITSHNFFMENPTVKSVTNAHSQFGSNSQINNFSFNLNHMNSNQRNSIQPNEFFNHHGNLPNINDTTYSHLDKLPIETVEIFQAKIFESGKVPLVPPPKELCMS